MSMTLLLGCWAGFGCQYRETVGTGNGGGGELDASRPTDCSSFEIPSGDCTLGQGSCNFASDCLGSNQECNLMTRRCFSADEVCVGTPCGFDEDCPSNERCNQTANICFDLSADQRCMPCFLLSTDCGTGTCDTDLGQCM